MAFFDEVSKKLAKAGQGVAQSTKNVAAVAKLNSSISDEEKNINHQLALIGQAYYDLHQNDPEDAMAMAVQSIRRSKEQIAQYKEQILQIKGIVNCPNCGAEVPYSAAFCNTCGHKMPQPTAPQPEGDAAAFCQNCGARLSAGQKFCTTCGTPVPAEAEQACPDCEQSQ